MNWTQWLTLGIAVLGAGLSIFNTVVNYRNSHPRLQVSGFLQKDQHGVSRLRIKLVNTGRVPVTVEKVFLTGGRSKKPKAWQLREGLSINPKLPRFIQPGDFCTITPAMETVERPFVDHAFTVMAQAADGRRIKASCRSSRQLAAEAKAAATKSKNSADGRA